MNEEIILNAEELKELKAELIKTYTLVNGKAPTEKWLNKTIKSMLGIIVK